MPRRSRSQKCAFRLTVDAPDAADYLAMVALFNSALEHDLGMDHLQWMAEQGLPAWQDETDTLHRGFLARDGDTVVGALQFEVPLDDGAPNIEFDVAAHPNHRGRGIEAVLLAALEREARDIGRPVLQTFSVHRIDVSGPRMPAPNGFGSIPTDDDQTRFLTEAGYALSQVERNSSFDLTGSLDGVGKMLADALAFAGEDYRSVTWTIPTPEEFKEGFAYVISRMSTDVPVAGLVWAEESWDVARVERRDANLAAGGHTVSVACVIHVPSGQIVAYNELVIGDDHTRPTSQWGTLVLREHRGHRLGTIVKCANILRWRDLVPESPFISTFNAEENRPMLDVNEAIGFVPLTVAGAWRKNLT